MRASIASCNEEIQVDFFLHMAILFICSFVSWSKVLRLVFLCFELQSHSIDRGQGGLVVYMHLLFQGFLELLMFGQVGII